MSKNNLEDSIVFFADKIHVHRWPMTSPLWSEITKEKIDVDLNKNKETKKVIISKHEIKINYYVFDKIGKVGITIPLFKNQATMVFEGYLENLAAHVHVTTFAENYLEIFNRLMSWKNRYFKD